MNIIDLVDSDEESLINIRRNHNISTFHKNHRNSITTNRNMNSNIGRTFMHGNREIIDLISDDDEPIPNPLRNNSSSINNSNSVTEKQEPAFKKRRLSIKGIEIKIEYEPKKFGEANQGEEVIEVHGESNSNDNDCEIVSKPLNIENTKINIDNDEDIVCVGGNMNVASDMPHQREACSVVRFVQAPIEPNCSSTSSKYTAYLKALQEQSTNNLKCCQMCYCYICEVKASECMEWIKHCNANCNDYKSKQERNARNMKLLQLMSHKTKAKFYSRFQAILTASSTSTSNSSLDFDYNLFDSDDDFDKSNKFTNKSGNLSSSLFLASCVNDFLDRSKCLKLMNTKESIIKANDYYLQSSVILIRIVASNDCHSNISSATSNYKIWIDWLFHRCSSHKVRTMVLEEIRLQLNRTYNFSTAGFRSLIKLFEMNEITFNSIINPQVSPSNPFVHSYITELPEFVFLLLLENFTENNYDYALQNIFRTIPNRSLALILLYLNKGTLKDSMMAMDFLTKADLNRSWILDKKKEFEKLSIQKIIYFLIAAISTTIEAATLMNKSNNSPTKKNSYINKYDNLIDILFNILFHEVFSESTQFTDVYSLCKDIQVYTVEQNNSIFSIENVKNWIEFEIKTPEKIKKCSIYLYISYCHWKLYQLKFDSILHREISSIIITPAIFWNLTPCTLVLLANSFCCYFKNPNHINNNTSSTSFSVNNNNMINTNNKVLIKLRQAELSCYSYLNLNISLGCQIISRIFDYDESQNKLLTKDFFNYVDSRIISVWSELPFIHKKNIDCSYSLSCCLEVLHVSYQEQNTSSTIISTLPYNQQPKGLLNSFWKEYLEDDTTTSTNHHHLQVIPIINNIFNTNKKIEYCGKHYKYEELMKILVEGSNEGGLSLLCIGHRLNISSLIYILDHCIISVSNINSNNMPINEFHKNNWKQFLNLNFNQLSIIWKGFIINSYMIFNTCNIFWYDKFHCFCTKFYNLLELYHLDEIDIGIDQSSIVINNNNNINDQLLCFDSLIKTLYYFTNMHIIYQLNLNIDCQEVITKFKEYVLNNENMLSIEVMKLVCQSYLLEESMMSIQYITWSTFWIKLLNYITFDQNYRLFKPRSKEDAFAVAVVLEEWTPLEGILKDLEHGINCINAIAKIKYSSFTCTTTNTMNRSNSTATTTATITECNETSNCMNILQNFITNFSKSNDMLSFLSEKCMEQSDSLLAYLVEQLDIVLIISGALDMYPYFAYILQLKFNEYSYDISKSVWLQDRKNEINRRYDDFVNNISLSTPNSDYKNALYCCVYLKRHEHVRFLLSMGINELLNLSTNNDTNTTNSLIENNLQRNVLLQDMLRFSNDIYEFVDIAEMILIHLSDLYLYSTGVIMMNSIYQKFYVISNKTNKYPLNVTYIINLLQFYHNFNEETFMNLWEGIILTDDVISDSIDTKKIMLLQWINNLEEVNERFNMITILIVRYYICSETEFINYLLKQINTNNNPHLESITVTLFKLILPNQKINYLIIMIIISTLLKLKKLTPTIQHHIKLCSILDSNELYSTNLNPSESTENTDYSAIINELFLDQTNKWVTIDYAKIILYFIKNGVEINTYHKDVMIELFKKLYFEDNLQDILGLLLLQEYQAPTVYILLQAGYQLIHKNNLNNDYFKVFASYINQIMHNLNTNKENQFVETISNILCAIQASISNFTDIYFFDIMNPYSFINQIANIFLSFRNAFINFMEVNSKLLEIEIIEQYIIFPKTIRLQLKILMEYIGNIITTIESSTEYEKVIISYIDIHLDNSVIKCENFYQTCIINNKSTNPKDNPQLFYDTFMKILKYSRNCLLSLHIIKTLFAYIERQEGKVVALNLKNHKYSLETIILQCINNPTCYYSTTKKEYIELVKYGFLWIPINDGYYTLEYCMSQLYQLLEKYNKKTIELANLLVEPILGRMNYGKISYKLTNKLCIDSIDSPLSMQKWIDLTILSNNTIISNQNKEMPSNQSYFKDIFQYFNTKCNDSLSYFYSLSQLFIKFSYTEFIDKQHISLGLKVHSIYFINIMMRIVLKHIIYETIDHEDIAKVLILKIHFPENRFDYFFNISQRQLIISMVKEYTNLYSFRTSISRLYTSNSNQLYIMTLQSFLDFPELLYLFGKDYKNKESLRFGNVFITMDLTRQFLPFWINAITKYNMLANIIYEISSDYFNDMINELTSNSVKSSRRNEFEAIIINFKEFIDLYQNTNFFLKFEKLIKEAKTLLKNKSALVKILKIL